jgi:hypothetical protein
MESTQLPQKKRIYVYLHKVTVLIKTFLLQRKCRHEASYRKADDDVVFKMAQVFPQILSRIRIPVFQNLKRPEKCVLKDTESGHSQFRI